MLSFHPDVLSATKGRRSCSAVKGLMISGVPPAADVRGMAVNRDEVVVFFLPESLGWRDRHL